MSSSRNIMFERLIQKVVEDLRLEVENEVDVTRKNRFQRMINDLQDARYNAEERLKNASRTWGGTYGYLPSGVIDYLEDDFEDRFSFDDRK